LELPDGFQVELAHAAVEAGADAVVCHGPHVVRGLEIYQAKPVFHGLGNFIFQNETLTRQPADFFEQFGLGAEATVAEAFDARDADRRTSFSAEPAYWQSVVAFWRYEAGRLSELRLYPITLGQGLPRPVRGRPRLADGGQAQQIIERIDRLSRPFGVKVRFAAGIGIVDL
jgi:poly-gamma-glutamate synthesis protein (capsule biosynthesis protein)